MATHCPQNEAMKSLQQNPCQAKCDWCPTGEGIDDELVFACTACGSEWTRHEAWKPRDLDGSVATEVEAELSRAAQ